MIQAVFIRVVLPLAFEVDTDSLGEYDVSSFEVDTDSLGEYDVSSFEPKVDHNDESTHQF